jgi:hypothetical protein
VPQLDAQDRRLQFVDPKITADERVEILGLAAVHAQHPHVFGQIRIVGGAQPRIAERAEILAREERKAPDVADRPDARSVGELGADGLRGVLDDAQAVPPGDANQRIHVRGLTIEMHRHERPDSTAGRAVDQGTLVHAAVPLDEAVDRRRR